LLLFFQIIKIDLIEKEDAGCWLLDTRCRIGFLTPDTLNFEPGTLNPEPTTMTTMTTKKNFPYSKSFPENRNQWFNQSFD
jgi:hypothetical protein